MDSAWYQNAYRRNVIDMHIADWDERFFSEFNPDHYVEMLKRSQVDSAVIYTNSCVGLCYYPTKVGRAHCGTRGRDFVQELIDRCQKHHIAVVLYYSLIFDNYAWLANPGWRIIDVNGHEAKPPHKPAALRSRFKICCPNSPYHQYVAALTQEICSRFEFDGIRFDMTFWPTVCYCKHCRQRFENETGKEMPTTIDWLDPTWVALQRKREQWLIDFAAVATGTARNTNPSLSIEHQASTFIQSWRSGVVAGFSQQHDFLQGDFYGDITQGILARKMFYNLTEKLPYGFETSFCVDITDHTAKKSTELLEAKAFSSLADGGAFVFIDGIDPAGTLNPRVYETMGTIFDKIEPYRPFIGGQMCQDIGVYLSCESKFDFADSGKRSDDPTAVQSLPHVEGVSAYCKILTENHLPFGVITRKNLDQLSQHRVIILSNVLMMDEVEVRALRDFVKNGGCLYATKTTSLITSDGQKLNEFALADVFGVSYQGETKEPFTYIAPTDNSAELFGHYSLRYPVAVYSSQMLVSARKGAHILGTLILPWTNPGDLEKFASQHSNPPEKNTSHPAIVMNRYGEGTSIFITGDMKKPEIHNDLILKLLSLFGQPLTFSAQAPPPVQITVFHQPQNKRYLVNLVNFQQQLPNIPVHDIQIELNLADKKCHKVALLPSGRPMTHQMKGPTVHFTAQILETFAMYAVDYE